MKPRMLTEESRTPIPDPTELTTEALKLSIANLKELLESKILAIEESLGNKIGFTNILKEEKFKELREKLQAVEEHRKESKADSERALEHALSAQKELFEAARVCNEEANNKAEMTVTKQLDALAKLIDSKTAGLDEKIQTQKERLDRMHGGKDREIEGRQTQSWLIPVIVVGAIAVINLVLNFIEMLNK